MQQVPFTPQGVQDKQAELYALPDSTLLTQANLVRTQFRQWVKDNFTLNTEQSAYLDSINEGWIRLASCQAGFAIESRLPIALIKPPVSGASKLIRTNGNLEATHGPGGPGKGGTLTFEIIYE